MRWEQTWARGIKLYGIGPQGVTLHFAFCVETGT